MSKTRGLNKGTKSGDRGQGVPNASVVVALLVLREIHQNAQVPLKVRDVLVLVLRANKDNLLEELRAVRALCLVHILLKSIKSWYKTKQEAQTMFFEMNRK